MPLQFHLLTIHGEEISQYFSQPLSPPSSTTQPRSCVHSAGVDMTRLELNLSFSVRWTYSSTRQTTPPADVRPSTNCSQRWGRRGRTHALETQVNGKKSKTHKIKHSVKSSSELIPCLVVQEVPSSLKRRMAALPWWGFSLEEVSTVPSWRTPTTTGRTRPGSGCEWDPSRSGSRASSSRKLSPVRTFHLFICKLIS